MLNWSAKKLPEDASLREVFDALRWPARALGLPDEGCLIVCRDAVTARAYLDEHAPELGLVKRSAHFFEDAEGPALGFNQGRVQEPRDWLPVPDLEPEPETELVIEAPTPDLTNFTASSSSDLEAPAPEWSEFAESDPAATLEVAPDAIEGEERGS